MEHQPCYPFKENFSARLTIFPSTPVPLITLGDFSIPMNGPSNVLCSHLLLFLLSNDLFLDSIIFCGYILNFLTLWESFSSKSLIHESPANRSLGPQSLFYFYKLKDSHARLLDLSGAPTDTWTFSLAIRTLFPTFIFCYHQFWFHDPSSWSLGTHWSLDHSYL